MNMLLYYIHVLLEVCVKAITFVTNIASISEYLSYNLNILWMVILRMGEDSLLMQMRGTNYTLCSSYKV